MLRRKAIPRISPKRKAQIILEKELALKLYEKQGGKCAKCGDRLGWRSSKHEIKFRSQGGSPIDEKNATLLCGKCHSLAHNIREVDSRPQWTRDYIKMYREVFLGEGK